MLFLQECTRHTSLSSPEVWTSAIRQRWIRVTINALCSRLIWYAFKAYQLYFACYHPLVAALHTPIYTHKSIRGSPGPWLWCWFGTGVSASLGRDGKGWCHLPHHHREAKAAPAPWLPSTSKTQQNGYSLLAKKKPWGTAQGPHEFGPWPHHPLSRSILPTWPAALSSSQSPQVDGSQLPSVTCQGEVAGNGGQAGSHLPVGERRKPCCCFCNRGSVPGFTRVPVLIGLHPEQQQQHHHHHVSREGPSSCKISQETPGAATVSQCVVIPRILAARQQPHTPLGAVCRCPGPQQGHHVPSVQHLLREVSQLPLLLHRLGGLSTAGGAPLLGQGSTRPPWPPAARGRAGALQLRTLLLVVLGIAGEGLAAAGVLLLHGAAHVLLAQPRGGRRPLLRVLTKVDNNDVALEIHYLSTWNKGGVTVSSHISWGRTGEKRRHTWLISSPHKVDAYCSELNLLWWLCSCSIIFSPVTWGCSYNQCLPLDLFIISIFISSGQSLSYARSLSGRVGNIFPLSCDLGSQREGDDLVSPVLSDAQSCVQSASACSLWGNANYFWLWDLFFPRVPEITLLTKEAINPQSILPFGLGSTLTE